MRSHDPEGYAGGSLLLVGSPMPDRLKVMTQTKRDAPPGWGLGEVLTMPLHKNTHVKKHSYERDASSGDKTFIRR